MALSEQGLHEDLTAAMRAKDTLRTRVLRTTLAAVKKAAIDAKPAELSESEVLAVLTREAKQCRETLEHAREAGRSEMVEEHEAMLAVLESYLPKQLGEEELRAVIAEIAQEIGATAVGPVMKELSARHRGTFDGKLASRIAAEVVGR